MQRPKPHSVRLARFLTPYLKFFEEPIPQGLRPTPIVEAAPHTRLGATLAYAAVGIDISGLSWTALVPDVAETEGFEPSIRV